VRTWLALAVICSALIAARAGSVRALAAQSPREFEIASVKPNLLDDRIVQVRVGPGPVLTARGYTLVLLMQRAYGVMDWNVTGGPDWIRTDRWDVTAKADIPGDLTEDLLQPMLASLLAKRFKLRVHETTQDMDAYALEIARGGPKVTRSAVNGSREPKASFTATGLEFEAISMPDLARYVAGKLGLVAIDRTGLPGLYDVKAEWRVMPRPTDAAGADPREALQDAVLTALEQQLGLKLAAKKVPIRMIVIDSVEKASALEN
jgi:uncharacterized protein (TIGR03435 family)